MQALNAQEVAVESWKLESNLPKAGLPQFLRDLAQALESGQAMGGLVGIPVSDLRKLVIVAEATAGGYTLKLKAKRAGELRVSAKQVAASQGQLPKAVFGAAKISDATARAKDKYRQLKKTMQAEYKALQRAAQAGALPAQDVLESFLALCEAMAEMEQPLKGPGGGGAELAQANRAFVDDAKALRRAMNSRDASTLAEVLARLDRRKSACHVQFRER